MAGHAIAKLNFDVFGILSSDMDSSSRTPFPVPDARTTATIDQGVGDDTGADHKDDGYAGGSAQGPSTQKRRRTESSPDVDWEKERVAWLREDAPLRPPQDPEKSIEYHLGKAPVPRSFTSTHTDANGVRIKVLSVDHPFYQQHGGGGTIAWVSLPQTARRVQPGDSSYITTVGGEGAGEIVYLSTHFYGPLRRGWAEVEIRN